MVRFTGTLRGVLLCRIENTNIEFLFGYIVEHISPRFQQHDWFASSYITHIQTIDDYYSVRTANSTYRISCYKRITIPIGALDNIRTGTPPDKAVRLFYGVFGQPLQ